MLIQSFFARAQVHLITFLMLLCLGGCASQPTCTSSACANDADITAAVKSEFDEHTELRPPNQISVQTLNGVVYLSGIVDTGREREVAESIAANVSRVLHVVNSIVVMNSVH